MSHFLSPTLLLFPYDQSPRHSLPSSLSAPMASLPLSSPLAIACPTNHIAFDSPSQALPSTQEEKSRAHPGEHRRSKSIHHRCLLCKKGIDRLRQSRPLGAGRAHNKCVIASQKLPSTISPPSPKRKLKDFDELGHSQRAVRVKKSKEALQSLLEEHRVPLSAILPSSPCSAASLIHLSTADRRMVRSIEGVSISSEKKVVKLKHTVSPTPPPPPPNLITNFFACWSIRERMIGRT